MRVATVEDSDTPGPSCRGRELSRITVILCDELRSWFRFTKVCMEWAFAVGVDSIMVLVRGIVWATNLDEARTLSNIVHS